MHGQQKKIMKHAGLSKLYSHKGGKVSRFYFLVKLKMHYGMKNWGKVGEGGVIRFSPRTKAFFLLGSKPLQNFIKIE